MIQVRYLRQAITANGGTPISWQPISSLRELVTAYGGVPTQYSEVGLLREAIVTKGGTPTKWEAFALLRELLVALGQTVTSFNPVALMEQLTTSSGAPDVTAPTLSSPTDAANGSTGATISVSTNEANGTLYWFISTSATPPIAANLKAGTGAVVAGSQAVSTTGVQNASPTGLTASTTYYAHFLHRDAAGNDSAIASADGFTTASAVAGTYTVNTASPMQTWDYGLGFGGQVDSLGASSASLPAANVGPLVSLSAPNLTRFKSQVAKGFNILRGGAGIYNVRGVSSDLKYFQERYAGQMTAVASLISGAAMSGMFVEWWAYPPYWIKNGASIGSAFSPGTSDQTSSTYQDALKTLLANSTLNCPDKVADPTGYAAWITAFVSTGLYPTIAAYEAAGVPVLGISIKNEPSAGTTTYPTTSVTDTQYVDIFAEVDATIDAAFPAARLVGGVATPLIVRIADSENGSTGAIGTALKTSHAGAVDVWTAHDITLLSDDSDAISTISSATRESKSHNYNEISSFASEYNSHTVGWNIVNFHQWVLRSIYRTGAKYASFVHMAKATWDYSSVGSVLSFYRPAQDAANANLLYIPQDDFRLSLNIHAFQGLKSNRYLPIGSTFYAIAADATRTDIIVGAWKKPNNEWVVVVSNRGTVDFAFTLPFSDATSRTFWRHRSDDDFADYGLGSVTGSTITQTVPGETIMYFEQNANGAGGATPSAINLSASTMAASDSENFKVAELTTTGDAGDWYTYELTDDAGGKVKIDQLAPTFLLKGATAATAGSINCTIKATNQFGRSVTQTKSITVSGAVNETETTTLLSAMTTAGVAPDSTRSGHINTLIKGLKDNGLWAKCLGIMDGMAGSETAGLFNWVAPATKFTKTGTGTLTWATGASGGVSQATNAAIDTGLTFTGHDTSAAILFRSETAAQSANVDMGNTNTLMICRDATDKFNARVNATSSGTTPANTDGSGCYISSRTGSTAGTNQGYKGGSALGTGTGANGTADTNAIRVLGRSGTVTWSGRQCSFAMVLTGLTSGEAATLTTLVEAYRTAVRV